MANWKPIRDKIIVRIKCEEEKSKGGIVLVDSHRVKEDMAKEEGVILAMGAACFADSLPEEKEKDNLKVGDTVAFARYGGKQLSKDETGNEIRVMLDKDILAIKSE